MKRKVIKQGHNTLTITLPSKWVKENGIEPGAELNYRIEGNSLVVNSDEIQKSKEYTMQITDDNIILEREIGSLFKKGYDHITINSVNPQPLFQIQDIVGYTMVGFEVVCQKKNLCEIKQVAHMDYGEFDSILNRTLFQLQVMAEGVYEAMKTSDKDALPSLKAMERNNNRYTAFLRRVINRGGYPDKHNDKILYTFIEFIEKIADEYKYMCGYMLESEKNIKKIPVEILNFFNEINEFMSFTIKSYYKFSTKTAYEHFKKRKVLIKRMIKFISSNKGRDCMLCHYALSITQEIADTWALILTMNQ